MNAHRREDGEGRGNHCDLPSPKRTGFPRPNPNDNITLDWKTCPRPARTAHLAAERQKGDGGGAGCSTNSGALGEGPSLKCQLHSSPSKSTWFWRDGQLIIPCIILL